MGFWLQAGGILLGAISLFNLVRNYFEIGLNGLMTKFIGFYTAIFHPIAGAIISGLQWMFALISIDLPEINKDYVILYLLIGASLSRYRSKRLITRGVVFFSIITIIFWPVLVIILIVAGESKITSSTFFRLFVEAIRSFTEAKRKSDLYFGWLLQIVFLLLAMISLFALNAFSP